MDVYTCIVVKFSFSFGVFSVFNCASMHSVSDEFAGICRCIALRVSESKKKTNIKTRRTQPTDYFNHRAQKLKLQTILTFSVNFINELNVFYKYASASILITNAIIAIIGQCAIVFDHLQIYYFNLKKAAYQIISSFVFMY